MFVAACVVTISLTGCYGSSAEVSLAEAQGSVNRGLPADLEWAELARLRDAIALPPQQDHPVEQNSALGRWSEVIDWPHIAAGAASLPSGRVASWSSSDVNDFRSSDNYTHAAIYDPVTATFLNSPNIAHNLFGASIAMMSDGQVVAVGNSRGVTTTSVLTDSGWIAGDSLPQTHAYGQTTTLADTTLVSIGGLAGDAAPASQWRSEQGWSELTGDLAAGLRALQPESLKQLDSAAALMVSPDGRLFSAGSGLQSYSLDPQGNAQLHGTQNADSDERPFGSTVLYDVGKILVAGGGRPSLSSAATIDINGPAPIVSTTSSMHNPRSLHNSVLLPNGQVVVIGGTEQGIPFADDGSLFQPELWDPGTAQWQRLASHRMPRNYQSTALLMKDARVISMGGGLCGNCQSNQQSAEIFEPPYLFNADGSAATRLEITDAPDQAVVGETLLLATGTKAGATIERFNLLRISAVSRHHNADQRLVPVSFSNSNTAENGYELYLSQNANILLPGVYWLYAIDSHGVPSIGHTLQILTDAAAAENESTAGADTQEGTDQGQTEQLAPEEQAPEEQTPEQGEQALTESGGSQATGGDPDGNDNNPSDETGAETNNEITGRDLPDGSLLQRGDVLALHYDVAADIDDIHAIASGKTITAFYDITPAVVVGTYGFDNNRRETYHVKFNNLTRKDAANEVATRAYGSGGYLDTKGYQADLEIAAETQAAIWKQALNAGNDVWVAEGGPSDFTEEVLQQLVQRGISLATLQTKVHIVQHSIAANEGNTDDQNLVFVKANTDYITLQNGNQPNLTADLNTGETVDDYFRDWASNSVHPTAWEFSMVYFEEKLDFSDTVEILHILNIGIDLIADTNDFADFFD